MNNGWSFQDSFIKEQRQLWVQGVSYPHCMQSDYKPTTLCHIYDINDLNQDWKDWRGHSHLLFAWILFVDIVEYVWRWTNPLKATVKLFRAENQYSTRHIGEFAFSQTGRRLQLLLPHSILFFLRGYILVVLMLLLSQSKPHSKVSCRNNCHFFTFGHNIVMIICG